MSPKATDRRSGIRSRRSLVSPLLEEALRGTQQVGSVEEPWRNRKAKGKNKGKRKK
jgi:hypothetical protein